MTPDTHRERIVEALRQSSRPLDDEQLAGRANIHAWQTVVHICLALEGARIIRRYPGPDGRTVNELVPQAAPDKRLMLDLLGDELGMILHPERVADASGSLVEVDGTDPEHAVLVECWNHQGAAETDHLQQVLAAAFKLTWLAAALETTPRLIVCSCDKAAAASIVPGAQSWMAQALQDAGITVAIVTLPTPGA